MKLCLIQMNSGHDKAANLEQASALIERAMREEKPDWIGLPEVFDYMGGGSSDKIAAAEHGPDGPAYRMCQSLARQYGVFIHGGSILEKTSQSDKLYNATYVFDRQGHQIAHYRKIHLFDVTTPDGAAYRESAVFSPGSDIVTYDCEGVKFGCAICYDLRFPVLFQRLVDQGAEAIVLPAAFTMQTGKDHWEPLCRARAIETQSYFIAPAQTGPHQVKGETRYAFGHSLVCDPWGLIVAQASDGPGYICAHLDTATLQRVRRQIPALLNRAPL